MEIFIAEQCKSLAESFIMGLIFGAEYDIISIFYRLCGIWTNSVMCRKEFFICLLGDSLFMLWMTVCTSLFLYCTNHGQFRLYLAVGCIAGIVIYRKTLSKIFMPAAEALMELLKIVLRLLLVCPLFWLLKRFYAIALWIFRHTAGVLQSFLQVCILKTKQKRICRRFPDFVRL